jgi:hypothetical protein
VQFQDSIKVAEVAPGEHRWYLVAGTTGVDDVIAEVGHEPNGVVWEGIAELLITSEAPRLARRFRFDSEAGAFLAYSGDRAALDDLAIRLRRSPSTAIACDSWWNLPGVAASSSTSDLKNPAAEPVTGSLAVQVPASREAMASSRPWSTTPLCWVVSPRGAVTTIR